MNVMRNAKSHFLMGEDLFEYPGREPWSDYPWIFRPKIFKILLSLVIIVCMAGVFISFIGIPRDAEMTTSGLENIPVPIAISIIILFVLPLPCLVVGLLLGLIPIRNVTYKVKFLTIFLMVLLLIEIYGLKELIEATIHG
jgi:hypothetical protein